MPRTIKRIHPQTRTPTRPTPPPESGRGEASVGLQAARRHRSPIAARTSQRKRRGDAGSLRSGAAGPGRSTYEPTSEEGDLDTNGPGVYAGRPMARSGSAGRPCEQSGGCDAVSRLWRLVVEGATTRFWGVLSPRGDGPLVRVLDASHVIPRCDPPEPM